MELTPHAIRAVLAQLRTAEVASACGVTSSAVSRWRNGTRGIPLAAVPSIFRLAGAHISVIDRIDATPRQATVMRTARREWQRAGGAAPALGELLDVSA